MLSCVRPALVAGLLLLAFTSTAAAAPRPGSAFDFPDRGAGAPSVRYAPLITGAVNEDGRGVPDVGVFIDGDQNGVYEPGETRTTTNAEGEYSLQSLPGGNVIRIELPGGYECGTPEPCWHYASTESGDSVEALDFSIWREGTISGSLMEDSDGDGRAETGDGVFINAGVYLDLDGDGVRGADEPRERTDMMGEYRFAVSPGQWTVAVEVLEGSHCSVPARCRETVTVGSGQNVRRNFLTWRESVIRGTLFVDLDADGAAREPEEPAFDDGAVYIDLDEDGSLDPDEPTDAADEAGRFSIGGLAPGRHVVRPLAPDGWGCLSPVPCQGVVVSTTGSDLATPDFGMADVSSDLSVSLDRRPEDVVAGSSVQWTLTVRNAGPVIANNAMLDVTLPGGLSDSAVTAPDGMFCDGVRPAVQCELGDLMVGASVEIVVFGTVEADGAGGALPLSARVSADNEDLDPSDNEAGDTPPVTGVADLRATAGLPAAATVGEVADLLVQVRNHGPSDASDVTVVATLPEGVDPVTDDLPAGCTVDGRALTCVASGIEVGRGTGWSIPLRLGAAAAGRTLTVPVAATSDATDPSPENATTEIPLEVRAAPVPAVEPAPAAAVPAPKPEAQPELVVEAPPAPAASECRSTRMFDVRVGRRHGRLRQVTMTLAGRPLAVRRRNGRFTARVDLRGRPAGEWVLRIRAVTARGKVIRGTRTYHTCTDKKVMGLPPL